jgi:hypothetical protein
MTRQHLKPLLARRPFQAFRLVLTSGKSCTVASPRQCSTTPSYLFVRETTEEEDRRGAMRLLWEQVERIEMVR